MLINYNAFPKHTPAFLRNLTPPNLISRNDRSEGIPLRDISSLGAMDWGLAGLENSSDRRRRRRRRPLDGWLMDGWLMDGNKWI